MNCRDWEERIALQAEGDLPEPEVPDTERHLAECGECRKYAQDVRSSLAVIRAAHEEPLAPAHFATLRARVLEQLPGQRRQPWRWAWIGALVAAAAVVVVLALPRQVELPRIAVTPPPAPLVEPVAPAAAEPIAPKRPAHVRRQPRPRPPAEPLMVKLITDDPDVVIYWIAN